MTIIMLEGTTALKPTAAQKKSMLGGGSALMRSQLRSGDRRMLQEPTMRGAKSGRHIKKLG